MVLSFPTASETFQVNEVNRDHAKRAAGECAASWVQKGMRVGLGTGSTTTYALEALGRRVREEGLSFAGVATSMATERTARRLGLPLVTLAEAGRLDMAIDGADEIDPEWRLIKGGGGAHTREKIVAAQADRFVVLVDESKVVRRLGSAFPVPVEVVPLAVHSVTEALRRLGAAPTLRLVEGGTPACTDQDFHILDAFFDGGIENPEALGRAIKNIPGVLDHGIFAGYTTDVLVGNETGGVRTLAKRM